MGRHKFSGGWCDHCGKHTDALPREDNKLLPCPDAPDEGGYLTNETIAFTVREEVKRQRNVANSRQGSLTQAEYVDQLKDSEKLISSAEFDNKLKEIGSQADFWVSHSENPVESFPPFKSGEKTVVQPFFDTILNQFNTIHTGENGQKYRLVYGQEAASGRYNMARHLPVAQVRTVPLVGAHNNATFGSRKPDVPFYYESTDVLGELRMVSFVEAKPRSSTTNSTPFAPEEVGQVICTAEVLLRKQPQRKEVVVGLSDGVRFQFFHVLREAEGGFFVKMSSMHLNMAGWKILFGLFLTDPRELGFLCYDLPGYDFIRMLGQGAHSTVYAVTKTGESVEHALKLFTAAGPRDHEHAMLTRLAGLQGMTVCVPSVIPKVIVTEILSQEPFYGILTLPICAPIRPERAGVRLTRRNVKELLATLKVAHAHGIVNGDLKPKNILMHVVRNRAVICDWGTAVEGALLPRSVGTMGYDDFSLGAPQVPSVASDLKAFVRTVYANFTDQCVPTELPAADAFWMENCGVGTVWAEALALAQAGNHDALGRVLEKL